MTDLSTTNVRQSPRPSRSRHPGFHELDLRVHDGLDLPTREPHHAANGLRKIAWWDSVSVGASYRSPNRLLCFLRDFRDETCGVLTGRFFSFGILDVKDVSELA